MATPEIIAKLRRATAEAHARLEAALDLPARLVDADERRRLVSRFLSLHESAEARLEPWSRARPELEAATRPPAPLIRADLALLGGAPQPAPLAPAVDSLGRALGWHYVLEGSALGGRVIEREMARRGLDPRGLSFLNPYGEQTGVRWRGLVDLIEDLHRHGAAAADDVVAGGVEGFAHAERVLCGA